MEFYNNLSGETSRRKILIISYVFPPYPGIGGRRWAKIAKYLTRQGFEVHVICAKNPNGKKSVWCDDVEKNKFLHIHEVNSFFPKVFTRAPRHFIDKIVYRFWKYLTLWFYHGYIYDRTIFSTEKFVKKADEVINGYNIKNVIVTGAPFRLVHAITQSRGQWPGINLIADFRDPWTWEHDGDYQKLDAKNLAYEKQCEAFVMEHADYISVPTKNMLDYLQGTYVDHLSKVFLIPHAWDADEISSESKPVENGKIILFGTLYQGIDNSMKHLARALVANRITLDIFSETNNYKDIFENEGASDFVTYHSPLPSKELFRIMKSYMASIIINNDCDKDHVSTKFIELAASRVPVIYVANKGKAGDFVTNKGLGWHISPVELNELLRAISSGECKVPDLKLELDALSFNSITRSFVQRISSNNSLLEVA